MAETDATDGSLSAPTGENTEQTQEQNQAKADGGAQAGAEWVTALPVELQKVAKAKGWKTQAEAIKSYTELEKYSSKAVQDMSPEERERFYKRVGRPDKPDEYELSQVALPNGGKRDPSLDAPFRKIAHELGLSKSQAKALHEWADKSTMEGLNELRRIAKAKREEAVDTLRKDWGSAFEANVKSVQKLVADFGGSEVAQLLNSRLEDGTVLGDHPTMMRFLKRLRGTMSEETLVSGTVQNNGPVVEPGSFDWSKVPSVSGENRYARR